MAVSLPFQQHSNLSKMQSFSYSEHNFDLKYSWTWNMQKSFNDVLSFFPHLEKQN